MAGHLTRQTEVFVLTKGDAYPLPCHVNLHKSLVPLCILGTAGQEVTDDKLVQSFFSALEKNKQIKNRVITLCFQNNQYNISMDHLLPMPEVNPPAG